MKEAFYKARHYDSGVLVPKKQKCEDHISEGGGRGEQPINMSSFGEKINFYKANGFF